MKKVVVSLLILCSVASFSTAMAGECTNNTWQPTFVRHDAAGHTVYYYTAARFVPMANPAEAQRTCEQQGVRNTINGQTCRQREWGGFGCGCNITPSRNNTCAAFQDFLRKRGTIR